MRFSATYVLPFLCAILSLPSARADDFQDKVMPFLKTYCIECHKKEKASAELDLTKYTSAKQLVDDFRQWEHVVTFVKSGEMPPKKAKQPSADDRSAMLKNLDSILTNEAKKLAGEPGAIPPRRLTNAEYDYTISDLTGVEIKPAKAFPVDPSSGEGFSNTGEALIMSPNLFKKYYAAGEFVSEHAVLSQGGLVFAPHPATTFADRQKYYERAIIRFYEDHQVNLEQYLFTLWKYQHRKKVEEAITLETWAKNAKLSPIYAGSLWKGLQTPENSVGPMKWLRDRWASIPAPKGDNPPMPNEIRTLVADINKLTKLLTPKETEAIVANAGNGPIEHLTRRRQTAETRDTLDRPHSFQTKLDVEFPKFSELETVKIVIDASDLPDLKTGGTVIIKGQFISNNKQKWSLASILQEHSPETFKKLQFGTNPNAKGDALDAESFALVAPSKIEIEIPTKAIPFKGKGSMTFSAECKLDRSIVGGLALNINDGKSNKVQPNQILIDPKHEKAKTLDESSTTFCRLFPSRFYYVDNTRGLSAGFHLIEGFFRDDRPLCKSVLTPEENKELDRLWSELYFVTGIWEKLVRGFVFFERSERNFLKHKDFDEFKEEDPHLTNDDVLERFQKTYLARSNVKLTGADLDKHPISIFFNDIRNGIKYRNETLKKLEKKYESDLLAFAAKAYRRPLTDTEKTKLEKFYRDLVANPEHGIEVAVRTSIVRVLVSPHFCYRFDASPVGENVEKLSDLSLASRLSYLLWSSQPDDELLKVAQAGKLSDPKELRTQIQRMVKDPKFARFSQEFFGQWLGYRDFLNQESVNRMVFPTFTDPLKQAMFEEPSRLATYLIQNQQPITELLKSDKTFVNAALAKHYEFNFTGGPDEWQLVEGLNKKGRGGVLGMGVFLTKNSQPQRTSPVKRGFWVVHKVLGEHIPPPPPDVAVLPAKETDTNGKTIRELLKLHTDDAKCAGCHQRFDSLGLAMEGFDPIGKSRTKDLAGRAIDNVVDLPNTKQAKGVPEFGEYLVKERATDFRKTLTQKFVGYALGRSLQLSDQPLLEELQNDLAKNNDDMTKIIERVILSPQFRTVRCRDYKPSQYKPISLEPDR